MAEITRLSQLAGRLVRTWDGGPFPGELVPTRRNRRKLFEVDVQADENARVLGRIRELCRDQGLRPPTRVWQGLTSGSQYYWVDPPSSRSLIFEEIRVTAEATGDIDGVQIFNSEPHVFQQQGTS